MSGRVSVGPVQPAPSQTIAGRYGVERLIGRGGVGSVYAVIDRGSGARLALKQLRPDASERAFALFELEYRTLSGLRHPCIVEVYDYGVDTDGAYYTMELVDGRDLSAIAPVPWRTACAYLRDAASIVGLLHARRLLHRDISPRNLLQTPAGRLKLIDLGALADFGTAPDVAGTPPYVPPEALRAEPLDQRSDLFALGALGYWLITGTHAFHARTFVDLPQLWQREPQPASALVAMIGADAIETPPPELDDVLATLLRLDRRERIATTAELIDRLTVIAELEPEDTALAVQGYLQSKAFVGREPEKMRVAEALTQAWAGCGQVLLIEGEPGVGRSRFMRELAVGARLDGALVLSADASTGARAYALAENLLAQLQEAPGSELQLSRQTQGAAPHGVAALRSELVRVASSCAAQAVGETRARLQNALLEAFCAAARVHVLALFVDDLHELDEESRAVLTALAHRAPELRLCLVASVGAEPERSTSSAIASLRGVATCVCLSPLTAQQTRNLLRSVFGDVPYLDRLSERLQRSAEGNPGHCLELAQHLVQTGAARYLEGSWALPTELPQGSLPRSRRAGLLSRIERLPPAARELAQAMSVPHAASWTIAHAASAAALPVERAQTLVALLEREGVVRARDDGYMFAHDDLRDRCLGALEAPRRREIHARLGAALAREAGAEDVGLALCACAHLLRAGDLDRALSLLKRCLATCTAGDPAHIGLHAAAFEDVFGLLRDAHQDDYALCGPLGMLSVAGYFADRRYALQYGERALEALEHVLRLSVARKLAPFVGRKLALLSALGVAGAGLSLRRACCLSLQENVRILLLAASTLAGTAAICMDPDRAGRYAKVIEPFTAFGPDHAAKIIHDFTAFMCLQGRDRPARCVVQMQAMMERLVDPRPIREMTDVIRSSYYAGLHLTIGVFLVRRDDRAGLAVADKLERFSPLYAMSADHLRANYYAGQGDLERAQVWRQKLEVHAVQLGSAWQVETWAPVDVINIAMRLNDAAAMKRAVRDLDRLSAELPSLAHQARYARISYLVLRGKYAEAIALGASSDEPPYAYNGWMRTRGTLARAHNALGQHVRARELCLQALAGADPDELQYVVMNLGVSIELALAEAGLGRYALAHAQLQKLLEQHAQNGSAVTLGSLHEARARVSLMQREFAAARAHLDQAQALYQTLPVASLIGRARALARELDRLEYPERTQLVEVRQWIDTTQMITRVRLLLRKRATGRQRLRGSLQVALELCGADEGFLVLAGSEGAVVAHRGGDPPSSELVAWSSQQLLESDRDAATLMTAEPAARQGPTRKVVGNMHYTAMPLWAKRDGVEARVAALALGVEDCDPSAPEPSVLRAIAAHLIARDDAP